MFKAILNSKLPKHTLRESGAGFTLVELLVVIAIIGILSSVAVINLSSAKNKAKEAAAIQDLANLNPVILFCLSNELDLNCGAGSACLNYFQYGRADLSNPFQLASRSFFSKDLFIKTAKATAIEVPLDSYSYEQVEYHQRSGLDIPANPPLPPPTPQPAHPTATGGFEISPGVGADWPNLQQYGWEYSDMVLYDFDKSVWEIHAQQISNNNRRILCSEAGCVAYDLQL